MKSCLFCESYNARQGLTGGIVYEDDFVYAYHYTRVGHPNYLGHLLLVTKRHVPGLAELTEAEGQGVGLAITRLSQALKACVGAEKIYAEAYYEVNPHLHIHLTARYPEMPHAYWRWNIGDWPEAPRGTPEEVGALCERLRTHLELAQSLQTSERRAPDAPTVNRSTMKSSILTLLHFARQQELKLIAALSGAERNATGTADSWESKDFLANIMCWRALQTQKLAAAQRGELPLIWKDMDTIHQINNQTFTRYQHLPFETVEQEAERVFNALIAQVETMTDEELNDPQHFAWLEGEPLRNELLGNGVWHPCDQLTNLALTHGHRQAAIGLQEDLLEAVRQSQLPAEGIGTTIYNLSCFYARNDLPEKAIRLLPEALRFRPALIEWSKHDSDFNGLRTRPDFQAIFADPALLALVPVAALISPQDLYAGMRGDTPCLVIDVRGTDEYTVEHVLGAIHIPLGKLETRLGQIPRDRAVVTYCNMHHRGVSRGERAAALLREQGLQARTLDGGYPAWKEQGLPVEAT